MTGVASETHTHYYKTWAEAAGLPEISASLEKLPAGLAFPENFPEPIRFDPERKRLVYRGFMPSASYRFLHALNCDGNYLEALDQLFEDSASVMESNKGLARLWPWLVGVSTLLGGVYFALSRLR